VTSGRDEKEIPHPPQKYAAKEAGTSDSDHVVQVLRHVEDRLETAEREKRRIWEATADAFISLDAEFRFRDLNIEAESMLDTEREELLGTTLWEQFPEALGSALEHDLRRSMSERISILAEIFSERRRRWYDIRTYPQPTEGLLVYIQDITYGKRIRERVGRTQPLESLGLIAGGVAHDFNNLLVGIIGNASLALETMPEADPVRRLIEDVMRASERAAELTRQLLAYASKRATLTRNLDVSEMVRDIDGLIQAAVPGRARVRLHLQDNLPSVDGNASQLHQLVMNLILNGAEAIPPDRNGEVVISTGVQRIDGELPHARPVDGGLPPGEYVYIEVRDDGAGMDETTKARIFDPFFTTKPSGRGLGLATVSGALRAHNGSIQVFSAPGEGSTFRVLLPVSKREVLSGPEAVSMHDLSGSGLVLVVDDEEIVRHTAKSSLERYGYNVIEAENGEAALDIFQRQDRTPALVLLDVTMPILGGEETLRRLKTLKPDVKVILTSGFSEAEALEKYGGAGMAAFLQKPYTAAQLAARVKSVLGAEAAQA